MGVAVPLRTLEHLRKIVDPEDFKQEVFSLIGNDAPQACGDRIVCVVYIRNEQLGTTGKLVSTLEQTKEDIWQGTAMLVVDVSPGACIDTSEYSWYGPKIKRSDWIIAKVSATTQTEIKRVPARIIHDYLVEAVVSDPRHVTS
jgi:hypothetical protein